MFQIVDYKGKRTQQRLYNVPLYVRVSPEDLGPHIGLNEGAFVLNMDLYEQPNVKRKCREQLLICFGVLHAVRELILLLGFWFLHV